MAIVEIFYAIDTACKLLLKSRMYLTADYEVVCRDGQSTCMEEGQIDYRTEWAGPRYTPRSPKPSINVRRHSIYCYDRPTATMAWCSCVLIEQSDIHRH